MDVLAPYLSAGDCVLAVDAPSTSFATGYVSAAAALLAERYPKASPAELTRRLESTASLAATGTRTDLSGWGVIRPAGALTAPAPAARSKAVAAPATGPSNESDDVTLVTSAVSGPDPRRDSKDAAVLWVVGGVAGVLLASLLAASVRAGRRTSTA